VRGDFELFALNRGVVAREALARLDLKRLAWAAEEMVNWEPQAVGPMRLRPGQGYLGEVAGATRMLPFVFSLTDVAKVEITAAGVRVWVDDELVTRATVTASIANGTFGANLTSWTDQDEVGGTSAWATGGYMSLTGDGTNSAIREQEITVNEAGTAHALRIVVQRGPVVLRIGSSSLGNQYLRDATLGTGTHDIVIVPSGNFFLQFHNPLPRVVLVDSVAVNSGAVLSLPSPYAADDLGRIRARQSGDVIYIACVGYQQRKIERRSNGSWSIVLYQPNDGPFRAENTGPTTISASALTGNVTLTASRALWDDDHVGALWRISSVGQTVTVGASAENTFTESIRVTGIATARDIGYIVAGTFVGTVTLQRSFDDVTWADVGSAYNWTAPAQDGYNDTLDNQIVYYRLGIKTGNYTSGTATCTLIYSFGTRTGVVRITAVASTVSASAEVLEDLGGTAASDVWAEGLWSEFRGWPAAVEMHDARLWWGGKDRFIGSVTDAFEVFDPDYEGDAGPIVRSIGFGPVDGLNWLLSLGRLMAGTSMHELACRSSSFDEPLTALNFTPKKAGTQGSSADAEAIEVDGRGVFVQRSGQALYELAYSIETQDYSERDLTRLVPGLLSPAVVRIAVQRKPETIVHCVLSDGTVGKLLYDPSEELLCWYKVETAGLYEDVVVLPGAEEDAVYYVVNRTIDGAAVRYLERIAMLSESVGGAVSKLADSFVQVAGPTATVTGLDHLEGESVVVWANGVDLGEFTVASGQITLAAPATNIVVGLGYEARWKGAKLGYVVPQGKSAFGAKKRVQKVALVLQDTHSAGIQFGPDFTTMDDLPAMRDGEAVTAQVFGEYDEEGITFPGGWTTDSRLCLKAAAPRPCMVKAIAIGMESN
jgi:hypothetical protein